MRQADDSNSDILASLARLLVPHVDERVARVAPHSTHQIESVVNGSAPLV